MIAKEQIECNKKASYFPPINLLPGISSQIPSFSLPFLNLPLKHDSQLPEEHDEKVIPKGVFNKTKFTPEEDLKLINIVSSNCCFSWSQVALLMQTRNARQCRERWNNYLNPYLRNDPWSPEEDALLMQKHDEYGTQWRKISKFFNNRSDNALRNRYNLLKRHYDRHHEHCSSPATSD